MIKHNGMIEDISNTSQDQERSSSYWTTISNVIEIIAQILEDIIKENITNEGETDTSTVLVSMKSFYVKRPPSKPINEYLQRIIKYSKPDPSSLIISLIYIDKLCEMTSLVLSYNNIHRLILAGFVIAVKFNEDEYYSNTYYAKVGGVAVEELNKLEYEMLQAFQFNTFVDYDSYSKYESQLLESEDSL